MAEEKYRDNYIYENKIINTTDRILCSWLQGLGNDIIVMVKARRWIVSLDMLFYLHILKYIYLFVDTTLIGYIIYTTYINITKYFFNLGIKQDTATLISFFWILLYICFYHSDRQKTQIRTLRAVWLRDD